MKASLAELTASSPLDYEATSLAHLDLGSFLHSSLQILLRSGWMGHSYFHLFPIQSGSSPGSGWATQGRSETYLEAISLSSWLCAQGCWPVGR